MRTDTTIATDIPALLAALRVRAGQESSGLFAFVPVLIASASTLSHGMLLPNGEVSSRAKVVEMRELAAEIRDYLRAWREAYKKHYPLHSTPEWHRRANKKIEVFFGEFFKNFTTAPKEFIHAMTAHLGVTPAQIAKKYAAWITLYALSDKRAIAAAHLARAYDLKLLLMGTLRLYGMTAAEIREVMRRGEGDFAHAKLG